VLCERDGESQNPLDVNIQTDHVIEHRRPDIIIVEDKTTLVVDIAVPRDTRV